MGFRLDDDDRETVGLYVIKVLALIAGVFGVALTLGLALRVFEIVRG